MNKIFVFLLMLFFHIVDDYYLQGILASMKQKEWWNKNAPQDFYKYDYIWALIMHSASWSFMIMLPIAIYYSFQVNSWYLYFFIANIFIHVNVDNLKANKKEINLWMDQLIHLVQIVSTFIFLMFIF